MIVTTLELVKKLKEVKPDGFEVSLRMGMLSTTKAVYLRRGRLYVFQMEYDFNFSWEIGFKEDEFLKKYYNTYWKIETTIG